MVKFYYIEKNFQIIKIYNVQLRVDGGVYLIFMAFSVDKNGFVTKHM